jgi:hypothetical protein
VAYHLISTTYCSPTSDPAPDPTGCTGCYQNGFGPCQRAETVCDQYQYGTTCPNGCFPCSSAPGLAPGECDRCNEDEPCQHNNKGDNTCSVRLGDGSCSGGTTDCYVPSSSPSGAPTSAPSGSPSERLSAESSTSALAQYDIGWIYPEAMPTPLDAQFQLAEYLSAVIILIKQETPIVVHGAHATSVCANNCIAYLDGNTLNVLTELPPLFRVPAFGYSSFSHMMCTAQCLGSHLQRFWSVRNLPVTGLDPNIRTAFTKVAATGDASDLLSILVEN